MSYTPGPLITSRSTRISDGGRDYAIATADKEIIGEAYEVTGEDTTQNAKANSTLWAAAPELLEALEEAKRTIKTWHNMELPSEARDSVWEAYQKSPEMKKINEAIVNATAL